MGLPPEDASESFVGVGPQNGNGTCDAGGPPAYDEGSGADLEEIVELTQLQRLALSNPFINVTLGVIVLNGLWIGVDVEWNHPSLCKHHGKCPLEPMSIVVENFFCVYFTFEIIVRILAFGKKNLYDYAFLFDFVLVAFMVIETWIMVIIEAIVGGSGGGVLAKFSTLRLMRLSRLARLLKGLPELLTLIKGIMNAAKAVSVVFAFMAVVTYIFAIIFTAQLADANSPERKACFSPYWQTGEDPTAEELFGSMGDSMMTLFTRGLLGDNLAETLQAIKDRSGDATVEMGDDGKCTVTRDVGTITHLLLMWVFIFFMCLSAFCLLNMLIGILCEVISGTSKYEEAISHIYELRNNIDLCFQAIEHTGDNAITKTEWAAMRKTKKVRDSFVAIGVEESHMDDRLDQIEEHLFGQLDKNKMLAAEEDETTGHFDWPLEQEAPADDQAGIPLQKFVDQILDIRPDQPASFLELLILQTRAERDELIFNQHLDKIETALSRKKSEWRTGRPQTVPNDSRAAPALAPVEESNNGTSSAPDPWLQGLPTELLFAELKHRATLQANSTLPAIDVD